MIDMTKWQEIAKANIHTRPATEGRLAGKIAIVTGAAQGFGKGIAEELYAEGATVGIADMNFAGAQAVAEALGVNAFAIEVNVTDEESVAKMVQTTVEQWGGLDLLVSNAGVAKAGNLMELEKSTFDFVTNINYTGYFLCAKYAAAIMEAQHEADPEAFYGNAMNKLDKNLDQVDFYLTEDGIVFYLSPDTIAPPETGVVSFEIKYDF